MHHSLLVEALVEERRLAALDRRLVTLECPPFTLDCTSTALDRTSFTLDLASVAVERTLFTPRELELLAPRDPTDLREERMLVPFFPPRALLMLPPPLPPLPPLPPPPLFVDLRSTVVVESTRDSGVATPVEERGETGELGPSRGGCTGSRLETEEALSLERRSWSTGDEGLFSFTVTWESEGLRGSS